MKHFFSLVAVALISLGSMAQSDYPLNFDPSTLMVRNGDRAISAITFTSADNSATVSGWKTTTPFPVYTDATAQKMTFKPGEEITPTVSAQSTGWMFAYIYIDYNKNGQFDYEDGELVTQTTNQENYSPIPSFTLPADLTDGDYRVRFKTDWDCEDPGGRYGTAYDQNFINDNRGQIIDFTLHINKNFTVYKVVEKTTLCNLYLPDGTTQLPTTASGDLTFKLVPMEGYVLEGTLQIKVGDNVTHLTADDIPADGIITVSDIDGDVTITAAYEQGPEATWRCIFNDEFNEEMIGWDDDKWGTRPLVSTVTWARFNSQRKEDGVCVQHDGHMSLKAKPTGTNTMLTGNLTSQEKFDFTYGRAEARCLVHPHKGNFPAFWMIPSAEKPNYSGDGGTWGSWPHSGEIDIMEQINTENRAHHTIHSHYANSEKGGLGQSYQKTANEYVEMNGKWHIYTLEWDEEQLRWYVDGKQVHHYDRIAAKDNDNDRQWPFDRPFYILVNQSVGDGGWAATPDFTHEYCMDVDYVRVYQRCEPTTGGNDNGNGSATALTHVWDTSQLVDGTQIVLEAREQRFGDTSINANAKGPEYFDGASAKSPSFDANKHVWVLEAAEAPAGKTGTWFYLKRAGDNGTYVGRNGTAIQETQNQANAEKFNIVNITANDLANNSYFISGTEITQTLRFIASDGTNFINAGNPQEAAKYAGGKGGLSVWYVYLYTDTTTAIKAADAGAMREGVVYNLNGQRVKKTAGVVIVNGKKIVVR